MSERRMAELRMRGQLYERKYKSRRLTLGPVSMGMFSIVLLLLLGIFYMRQTNKLSLAAYELSDLQSEKNSLLEDQERFQVEAARLQSVSEIKSSLDPSMVSSGEVSYVRSGSALAAR